jgi:hypothetical protein
MNIKLTTIVAFLVLLTATSLAEVTTTKLTPKKIAQLNEDLLKVWPFIQTIKVEYDLVVAQLETIETDSMKQKFLEDYEDYIEDTYFNKLIRLNIRQGRLLLLLIDREFGKTPYELLTQFRNKERADFWQKFAKVVDADLKGKYIPLLHPEIEEIILRLSQEKKEEYLMPKDENKLKD